MGEASLFARQIADADGPIHDADAVSRHSNEHLDVVGHAVARRGRSQGRANQMHRWPGWLW